MNYISSSTPTDIVKITMDNSAEIIVALDATVAPKTVANFKKLVASGFYNGLIFHRVIKDFMIQGGDPQGTGMGGSKENIVGEFKINGFNNTLSHKRGVISMARSQMPNSASSQFFICHADATFLDGQYASFGAVVSGIEVVDSIANVKTNYSDKPLTPVVMKSITFVTESK